MFPHKKLIVYLDQCLISEIAKTQGRTDARSLAILDLYSALKEGVNADKIVVPASFFHRVESAGDTRIENKIFHDLKSLGQIEFLPWWDIEKNQFQNQLLEYACKKPDQEEGSWMEAFGADPDSPLQSHEILVIGYPFHDIHSALDESSRSKIEAIKPASFFKTLPEQYNLEINAARDGYRRQIASDLRFFLEEHGITTEQAEAFISGPVFEQIAILHIASLMWARELTSASSRKGKASDQTDIQMLSTILPYADMLCTDTYMAVVVRELELDQKYETEIFSMKEEDVKIFTKRIREETSKRVPANIPPFSLLVMEFDDLPVFEKVVELISGELAEYEESHGDHITAFIQLTGAIEQPHFPEKGMPQIAPYTAFVMREIFLNPHAKTLANKSKDALDLIRTFPENFRINPVAVIDLADVVQEGLLEDIRVAIEKKLDKSPKLGISIYYSGESYFGAV